jgi:acyl dehydratase
MPINPNAIGEKTDPYVFDWTDRDTLLYAIGVGAGLDDLQFTTENSHDIEQQVLPTYAVIACSPFAAAAKIGTFNFGMLLHGSQEIRVAKPLPPAGKLKVVSEVADIQDKGEGKNAVVMLKGIGTDPATDEVLVETLTTVVIRGEGGFGGQPGQRPVAPEMPEAEPDARLALPTREDQALIYRLSGDRNPLHSDPWFAKNLAGFPRPILHGLCTYGVAGRALVAELCGGDATKLRAVASRFSSPVFPGETLTTSIWRTGPGKAVFRTAAAAPDGTGERVVLDDGVAEYLD